MSKNKEINIEKVTQIRNMGVAYNEEEFLLVFNTRKEDFSGGEAFALPVNVLQEFIKGLIGCGIDYQKHFNKDIGFAKEEE